MKLRLSLVRCPPSQGSDIARDLGGGRITIGRGSDNDWVLSDPERLLSKNHCMVEFKGGVYVVIDCSTNGVFLNDKPDPIGRGNSAVIGEGDQLRLGSFVIRAGFAAEDAAPANDPFLAVLRATDPPTDDFLGQPAAASDDPFALSSSGRSAVTVMPIPDDDELFGGRPMRSAEPWGGGGGGGEGGGGWNSTAASYGAADAPPSWSQASHLEHTSDDLGAMRIGSAAPSAIPDDWLDAPLDAPPPAFPPAPAAAPSALPDDWDDEPLVPPAFAGRPASPVPTPVPPANPQAQSALIRALVEALLTIDRRQAALEAVLGLDPDDTLNQGNGLLRRAADPDDALARLLALPPDEAADLLRTVTADGAAHQSAVLAAVRELTGETADGGARLAALYRRLLPIHRQALGA